MKKLLIGSIVVSLALSGCSQESSGGIFYIHKGKVLEVKIGEGDLGIAGTCFKALDKGKFLIGN